MAHDHNHDHEERELIHIGGRTEMKPCLKFF